ncbi:MAG: winged helix-turn-helix domain-containing protein, partial [Synergistaceae bacterium]|nr:winged helix-turn-helix domain-containing protein [Synergistaceae bacterium]
VFGSDVKLSNLQHKLIVILYKNPDITMRELKMVLGMSPDITTHSVETAIYQLRKKYGHNVILNTNGKYKIGQL